MTNIQTVEFNAASGFGTDLSIKVFLRGTDIVLATATAEEKANDLNRYTVELEDLAAADYRINGFVAGRGGYVNEIVTLAAATGTYYPWSENLPPSIIQFDLFNTNTPPGSFGGYIKTIKSIDDAIFGSVNAESELVAF